MEQRHRDGTVAAQHALKFHTEDAPRPSVSREVACSQNVPLSRDSGQQDERGLSAGSKPPPLPSLRPTGRGLPRLLPPWLGSSSLLTRQQTGGLCLLLT